MKINNKPMRDRIKALVKADPTLADDDKRLIASVWYLEGWIDPELYEKLKSVSSPETIRRTRAKLVEEGIIKPSAKVQEARYEEYKQARMSI
jgi:ribosomal protein L19E